MAVGGTSLCPASSSSVRSSSGTGTAMFVLGLSGEFGGALCGGLIAALFQVLHEAVSLQCWKCPKSCL